MRSRAYRIHQCKRWKKRVRSYWVCESCNARDDKRTVGRLARTPKPCSCFMCGNPRRYENERTRAERRADVELNESA